MSSEAGRSHAVCGPGIMGLRGGAFARSTKDTVCRAPPNLRPPLVPRRYRLLSFDVRHHPVLPWPRSRQIMGRFRNGAENLVARVYARWASSPFLPDSIFGEASHPSRRNALGSSRGRSLVRDAPLGHCFVRGPASPFNDDGRQSSEAKGLTVHISPHQTYMAKEDSP